MKLAVATSPHFFVEENTILQSLFEEGLDLLYVSKPESEPIYCERLLSLMPSKWYNRIVAADHFYLKNEYGLKGVHLSSRNPELPVGYRGFHSTDCDLYTLESRVTEADHVVLDVNPTILHRAKADHLISHKVYARGIHSMDEFYAVQESGFGGAVLDDVLWSKFDFHESSDFHDLMTLFRQFRKIAD